MSALRSALQETGLQKIATSLDEVWELRPQMFRDARGFFIESYNQARFVAAGITDTFVQDNHSCSVKGTLRGLHYQLHRAQAKLCRVVEGEALDVAVDIRAGSPSFGKWAAVVLSAHIQNQIYIPRGFAHGFLALTERVQFLYKCSDFYDAADEHAIRWDDPQIGIRWNISEPLVSEKDQRASILAEIPRQFLPSYRTE
ncbi:MAG TPA: dTDP-4-dehydrorhamnose 3,5-epimerase [Candidatus Acidoferrales bacterium]|nr:dTDP-4-dehydrorhamnose 3,5-epimerase [Candidatus Acidoferrales bacterium]